MSNQKILKSICINDLEPTITLTPIVESYGEKCRIHHIKSDSIAINGRDTFVPLRHVSKHRRKIFKLEEENAKLREWYTDVVRQIKLADYFDCFSGKCEKWKECHGECVFEQRARKLRIEV